MAPSNAPASCRAKSTTRLLAGCLVELDGVPVGVVNLDLLATRAHLDLVSEQGSCRLERRDCGVDVAHVEHDPVPSAWLLLAPVRHRPRARASRTAEDQLQVTPGD